MVSLSGRHRIEEGTAETAIKHPQATVLLKVVIGSLQHHGLGVWPAAG
jgi:hypothetical protein